LKSSDILLLTKITRFFFKFSLDPSNKKEKKEKKSHTQLLKNFKTVAKFFYVHMAGLKNKKKKSYLSLFLYTLLLKKIQETYRVLIAAHFQIHFFVVSYDNALFNLDILKFLFCCFFGRAAQVLECNKKL